jgi:hypothetical protein
LQMFAIAKSHPDSRVVNGVAAVVVAAMLIGTLYVGREVFVQIALAILLSFVLAPLVRVLERWHMPRPISVVSHKSISDQGSPELAFITRLRSADPARSIFLINASRGRAFRKKRGR